MTKMSYEVSSPHIGAMPSRTTDNSFKTCLCTMLVVLSICILLLLLAFGYGRFGSQDEPQKKQSSNITIPEERDRRFEPYGNTIPTKLVTETTIGDRITTEAIESTSEKQETTTEKRGISTYEQETSTVENGITSMKNLETTPGIPKEEEGATDRNTIPTTLVTETTNGDRITTEAPETTSEKQGTTTEKEEISTYEQETSTVENGITEELKKNNSTELDDRSKKNLETTPGIPKDEGEARDRNTIPTTLVTETNIGDRITTEAPETTSEKQGTTTEKEEISSYEQETSTVENGITEELKKNSSTELDDSSTKNLETTPGIPKEEEEARDRDDYDDEPGETDLRSSSENPILNTEEQHIDKKKCNSNKCSTTAARMLASMDLSKVPCENFYEYACGGGVSAYEEEEDYPFTREILERNYSLNFTKKFDIFYKSCLKHEDKFQYRERVEEAKSLLHSIGSFQYEGQVDKVYDVTELVATLILFKEMPLFDVGVDIDPKNDTYILKLQRPDQSSLKMEYWSSEHKQKCLRIEEDAAMELPYNISEIHQNILECQQNYSDFIDSIESSMEELGFFSNLTEEERSIESQILSKIEETKQRYIAREEIIFGKYKIMTVEELEKELPQIMWKKLFKFLLDIEVNSETVVQLHDTDYFKDVFAVFDGQNVRYLNHAFLAILAHLLFHNVVLPTHRHSRLKYCKDKSQELMPDILNYVHQKNIHGEEILESTAYVERLYENIKKHFTESLREGNWLDEKSKTSMIEKLDNLKLVFNYSSLENERDILETIYANLTLEDGNFQANLFNLMKYSRKRVLSLSGQKVTSDNMYRNFVGFSKDEPVFFYTSNIVCIPHGLIKKVSKELPDYIMWAQVGFPLAKIIGYSFDSIGMNYNVELQEPAQQIYSDFVYNIRDAISLSNPILYGTRKFSFKLNKALSQSERIAENTALRLLEEMFNTLDQKLGLPWMSEQFNVMKTFLLAVTQEFCQRMSLMEFTIQTMESSILPPQFRIENILSNSKVFSKEFGCKEGSGMTRMNSSSVFPYLEKKSMDYDK